jgi:hydroxymethylglutaryl-CoA synthase
MLTEIYALDSTPIALTGNEDAVEYQNKLKEISKTGNTKISFNRNYFQRNSLLVSNLYTGSIFMGLYLL